MYRSVAVMMVRDSLGVQHRMRRIPAPVPREDLLREGHALQADRGDENENDERAAHSRQNLYVARTWYSRGAPGATQSAANDAG